MARPPTENPYHHPFVKPHAFDCDAIGAMCLEGFEITMATRGVETLWNDDLEDFGEESAWSHPLLVHQHQDNAEERLSSILLSISASYRVLDDLLKGDAAFKKFKEKQLLIYDAFLTTYGEDDVAASLRECCSKVIHTEDFRPIYENGSQPQGEGVWSMTGEIELEGKNGKNTWHVVFDVFLFFEAMLETIGFLNDELEDADPQLKTESG